MNIQSNMVLNGLNAQQLFEFGKAGDSTAAQLNATFLSRDYRANVNLPNQRSNFKFVAPRQTQDETAARQANSNARQTFLRYILKTCGVETTPGDFSEDYGKIGRLPDVVREAMKCKGFTGFFKSGDWKASNGRPLTSRRIAAVMAALEVHKREEQYKADNGGAEMPAAVRNVFRSNPKLVGKYAYSLVAAACRDSTEEFVAFVKSDRMLGTKKFSGSERDGGAGFGDFCREFRRSLNNRYSENSGHDENWDHWYEYERNQWLQADDSNFVNAHVVAGEEGNEVKTNLRNNLNEPGKCMFDNVFGGLSTAQKTKILRLLNTAACNGFTSSPEYAKLLKLGDGLTMSGNNLALNVAIRKTGEGKWHFKVDVRQLVTSVTIGEGMDAITHRLVSPQNQLQVSAREAENQRKTHSATNCTLEYDVTADNGDEIEITDMKVEGEAHLKQFKQLALSPDDPTMILG